MRKRKKKRTGKRQGWVQLLYRLRPNLLEVIDEEVERRLIHANPGDPKATRTSVISEAVCAMLLVERGEAVPSTQLRLPRVK